MFITSTSDLSHSWINPCSHLLLPSARLIIISRTVYELRTPCWRRPKRKVAHFVLHTVAIVCITFGLIAAFQSHNLKKPVPIPNLYSAHSFLGLAVAILAYSQVRRRRSEAFSAEISVESPQKLFIFIIKKNINGIKVCKQKIDLILKKTSLVRLLKPVLRECQTCLHATYQSIPQTTFNSTLEISSPVLPF